MKIKVGNLKKLLGDYDDNDDLFLFYSDEKKGLRIVSIVKLSETLIEIELGE